ncbi:MAG: hypothetical protein P8Z36_06630 [Gemmatimonadota bacterium]
MAALADYGLCPRDCGVNRLAGRRPACETGRNAAGQQRPAWNVIGGAYAEIDRRVTRQEFREAVDVATGPGFSLLR